MLVADEVFGSVLSYGQCVRKLRRVDFQGVLYFLAHLNQFNEAAFEAVPLTSVSQLSELRRLLQYMLKGPVLVKALEHLAKFTGQFVPLSTQALMATIELAGRFSPRQSKSLHLNADERLIISHILLSFQAEALSGELRDEFRAGRIKSWADVSQNGVEQLIRNMTAHNPHRPYANSIARLYAYVTKPYISSHFVQRNGRNLEAWFEDNFGMSGSSYLLSAFLSGAAITRLFSNMMDANLVAFEPSEFFAPLPAGIREQLDVLLRVATIDGELSWGSNFDRRANALSDLVYESNQLHATPIVRCGRGYVITSTMLLWNLFICGLPHASLNAVRQRQSANLTTAQVKGIRAEFGLLFEGYVLWLFREWFGGRPVELLFNYEVKVGVSWRERDVAVIAEGIAFVFEVKGHVIDLNLRKTGSFQGLRRLVGEPVEQAYHAANAFLSGEVRRSDGTPVGRVSRVIPVALVYDSIPLNLFTGDHFEPWLEQMLNLPAFTSSNGRSGVLLMGIDDLESAESSLRMDILPEQLLTALIMRADKPQLRYERLSSFGSASAGPDRSSPVALLRHDSDDYLRCMAATFQLSGNLPAE